MNRLMKTMGVFALASLTLASCNKDPKADPTGLTAQEKALKAAVETYVPGVIYEIYGNLADETESLYNQLAALKAKDTYAQADIDAICTTFLSARKWWEQSEAFLYGAATAYGIDPHIDSWPLDKDKLAKSLSNAETIADLDKEGAGAVDEVGAASLGFHGIEFIIFRDGANRKAAALNGVEDDEAFAGRNVTGKSEVIFATAVAEDLRNYCFELQVAWDPDAPAARVKLVEDELELNTVMDSGLTLSYVVKLLEARHPRSVRVAAFAVKDVEGQSCAVEPAYVGTHIPDEFIVGYGLDFAERYRNLPYVGVLKHEVYQKD